MKVKLLHNTPLWVCSTAIRKCWASEGKSDTNYITSCEDCGSTNVETCSMTCNECYSNRLDTQKVTGTKDKELIERIGNKNKHSSTLEHLNYSFDIDGISRACLQELARHRHASLSVKSSRYTLKELKDTSDIELENYAVLPRNAIMRQVIIDSMKVLRTQVQTGASNDLVKYCIPEAYKTSLVWTINARSLQNFLALRTNKAALWEIQDLAREIYKQLPEEHKYLFTDFVEVKDDKSSNS